MGKQEVYKLALSMIPKVGPRTARKLVAYLGSIDAVFEEKKSTLKKVPGIGDVILANIKREQILEEAEKELIHLESQKYSWLSFLDPEYPLRLKECEDAPIVLYFRGGNFFNSEKIISIVGTRKCTEDGRRNCESLVSNLAKMFPDIIIVSGFAYGIDICAHKAALKSGLNTIAVLGNGIDVVYPPLHSKYVSQVEESGALVSEFPCKIGPDPGNFVSRNRIIAGLADASVIVESGIKGGALITADMGNSYNRDVFAYPGRVGDNSSSGCNSLIKRNMAALVESAKDVVDYLSWDSKTISKPVQQVLFAELKGEEQLLFELLKENGALDLDSLSKQALLPVSKVAATLLTLEFSGLVKSLPGKIYKLV